MDAVTESLLRDLETSPTDMKRLVVSAIWRPRTAIAIEAAAIARWERDDPRRWKSVQDWLLSHRITITVLRSGAALTTAPPEPVPQPPPAGMPG
jgi:hypothetical protein